MMMKGAIIEINLHREQDVKDVDSEFESASEEEKVALLHLSPLQIKEGLGDWVG
jgi:hypothetical protein